MANYNDTQVRKFLTVMPAVAGQKAWFFDDATGALTGEDLFCWAAFRYNEFEGAVAVEPMLIDTFGESVNPLEDPACIGVYCGPPDLATAITVLNTREGDRS